MWLDRAGSTCGEAIFLLETGQMWRMVKVEDAVNRKRVHILYTGMVQGVGFRYTVKSVATGFEVPFPLDTNIL